MTFPHIISPQNSVGQAIWLLCLTVILATAASFFHPKSPALEWNIYKGEKSVEMAEATHWGANLLWVDVRGSDRFDAEHLPDAIELNDQNWDAKTVSQFSEKWSPEKRVVVYGAPHQSLIAHQVGRKLKSELGVNRLFILDGGWPQKTKQDSHD